MPIRFTKAQKEALDITEVCALCEFAVPLNTEDEVLCRRNGIVAAGHRCKKFRYDLLKRKPAHRADIAVQQEISLPTLDDDEL